MEINIIFVLFYIKELSFEEVLQFENVVFYNVKKIGEKYLIVLNKG